MENVLIEYLNKEDMTTKDLTGVIFSRLNFFRTALPKYATIPAQLGEYYLKQEINNPNDQSEFRVALYESKSGARAFLKFWSGSAKTSGYYALKNEIALYSLLGIVPPRAGVVVGGTFTNVVVPSLIQSYENPGELGLLISEVTGETLEKFPLERQEDAFRTAVEFLSRVHVELSQNKIYANSISKLSVKHICYIFPPLLLFAVVRNPRLLIDACKAAWLFSRHLRGALSYTAQTLVHRDLTNTNLLVLGKELSVFDFESAVQAPPVLETAQFLVSICNSPEALKKFSAKPEFAISKTRGTTRAVQIVVSLYVAFLHLATRQQFDRDAYIRYLNIILHS